jgi:hypothetical protein
MTESVNDKIHADLISHDISLRRVTGDTQKRIERRLDRLGSDLKALAGKIDPFSASRADVQERRLSKLDKESRELITEAYKEISKITRGELEQLATIESEVVVQVLEKELQ